MAVLTFQQIKVIINRLTVSITGLQREAVRNTYPPQGQPGFSINDDYVFITLLTNPTDGYALNFYDVWRGDEEEQTKYYTRIFDVLFTLYGPNSVDLADQLRLGFLGDSVLSSLATNNIAPLTDIPQAARVPELFNGQWWERSDLRISFNVKTSRTSDVPAFAEIDIELETENNYDQLIHIEE